MMQTADNKNFQRIILKLFQEKNLVEKPLTIYCLLLMFVDM